MRLLSPAERSLARAVSNLMYCNPFLPERIGFEREVLGPEFVERGPVWSLRSEPDPEHPNLPRILARVESLVATLRDRLARGARATEDDLTLYEDLVAYALFCRTEPQFYRRIREAGRAEGQRFDFYAEFAAEAERLLDIPGGRLPSSFEPPHLFACVFQVRRAFHHIYQHIVGGSMAAARLRATVWESIFTHDMRRYRRLLYDRLGDITTLVTGPSGTGKELVARAIALSRYIPFDEAARAFTAGSERLFLPLNLSALSPTLIESELFGHRRGAFTGALEDRRGWLEVCSPRGTVFLDEIGDVALSIQAKLLRVLQTRTFERLGETEERRFVGKVIVATNRDLGREMRVGRFREDLYYRLCSDIVTTPSLRDQLRESPAELRDLILFISRQVVGEEDERLADEVERWVDAHLGRDYAWPGNFRELEQCVRNVLIRKGYVPPRPGAEDARERLAEDVRQGALSAEELLERYCTLVYARTGSYAETARRLGLDRRTVKSKVVPELLAELRGQGRGSGLAGQLEDEAGAGLDGGVEA